MLQNVGQDITSSSDDEPSPDGNKPTPIIHAREKEKEKEKDDEPGVPRPHTPRSVITNLAGIFDVEDLPGK